MHIAFALIVKPFWRHIFRVKIIFSVLNLAVKELSGCARKATTGDGWQSRYQSGYERTCVVSPQPCLSAVLLAKSDNTVMQRKVPSINAWECKISSCGWSDKSKPHHSLCYSTLCTFNDLLCTFAWNCTWSSSKPKHKSKIIVIHQPHTQTYKHTNIHMIAVITLKPTQQKINSIQSKQKEPQHQQ